MWADFKSGSSQSVLFLKSGRDEPISKILQKIILNSTDNYIHFIIIYSKNYRIRDYLIVT